MLRLKRYVSAVAGSAVLDAVLEALAVNTRVEVLYIQNFERGFTDAQLARLTQARGHKAQRLRAESARKPQRRLAPRRTAFARERAASAAAALAARSRSR